MCCHPCAVIRLAVPKFAFPLLKTIFILLLAQWDAKYGTAWRARGSQTDKNRKAYERRWKILVKIDAHLAAVILTDEDQAKIASASQDERERLERALERHRAAVVVHEQLKAEHGTDRHFCKVK